MRECLWLVKNNIPFDVAFSLDDCERTAYAILFSEMEGNKFNFDTMRFEEQK